MTQSQLHRAVAQSTGEDIDWIARRGFSLVDEEQPTADEDWARMALDWDQLDAARLGEAQIAT